MQVNRLTNDQTGGADDTWDDVITQRKRNRSVTTAMEDVYEVGISNRPITMQQTDSGSSNTIRDDRAEEAYAEFTVLHADYPGEGTAMTLAMALHSLGREREFEQQLQGITWEME